MSVTKVVTKVKPKPREKAKAVTEEMEVMKPDWMKRWPAKPDPNAEKLAPIGSLKKPLFPSVLVPMNDEDTMKLMNQTISSALRVGDDPLKMFVRMYDLFYHKEEGYYTIGRKGTFKMDFRGHFTEHVGG